MVMDKSSIKELYDNRDIIARMGNIEHELHNMPHGSGLTQLWEYMILFLNRYEYMMFEDKSAYIDALHEYEVAPRYTEDGPKYADIPGRAFLSKDMVGDLIEGHYLDKETLNKQTVVGPVEFSGAVDFDSDVTYKEVKLDDRYVVKANTGYHQLINNSVEIAKGYEFDYEGEDIDNRYVMKSGSKKQLVNPVVQFDNGIFVNKDSKFVDNLTVMKTIRCRNGEVLDNIERKNTFLNKQPNDNYIWQVYGDQLVDGELYVTGPIQGNLFKGTKVDVDNITVKYRPFYDGEYPGDLIENNFVTLTDVRNELKKLKYRPLYDGEYPGDLVEKNLVTLADVRREIAGLKPTLPDPLEFNTRPTIKDISAPLQNNTLITFADLKAYEPTPTPIPIDDFVKRTWKGMQTLEPEDTASASLSLREIPLSFNRSSKSGSIGVLDDLYVPNPVFRIQSAQINPDKITEILFRADQPTMTLSVETTNNDSKIYMTPTQILLKTGLSEVIVDQAHSESLLRYNGPFLDNRVSVSNWVIIESQNTTSREENTTIRINSSNALINRPWNYIMNDKEYTSAYFEKTSGEENGQQYEQIELPFDLMGKPFSLILKRSQNGNEFKDEVFTKAGNSVSRISLSTSS